MQTEVEPGTEFGIPSPFWHGRDALIVADAQRGRIIGWNPAAAYLLGYSPAEAAAFTLSALLPDIARFRPGANATPFPVEGPAAQMRAITASHKNGRKLQIDVSLTALEPADGSPGRVLAVLHDIGGSHQTDQEIDRLRKESHLLQTLAARQLERTAMLGEITKQLLAAEELDSVLSVVARSAWRLCDARQAAIALRDDAEGGGFTIRTLDAGRNSSGTGRMAGARLEADGLAGTPLERAFREQTAVTIEDVRTLPASPSRDMGIAASLLSGIAAPLLVEGTAIGLLIVNDARVRSFSAEDVTLIQTLADQAALAIEHARRFEQERQTAQELSSLLDISANLTSTLDLDRLLGLILDELKLVVAYTSATAITREGDRYWMREYRGPISRETVRSRSLPTAAVDAFIGRFPLDTTFIIPDVWADTPAAEAWRATGSEEYLRAAPAYMGCLLNAPLIYKGRLIGLLTLGHRTPGYFTERHAALTQAVAGQVAGLIEHARLFEQEQRTTQELTSLLEVSRNVASTLEMEPLLDVILEQLKVVADYRAAAISVVADDSLQELRRRTREGDTPPTREVSLMHAAGWWEPVARGESVIIDDVQSEEPLAGAYRTTARHVQNAVRTYTVRGFLAVPLTVKDRVMGTIVLSHEQPGFYTERHAALAMAIGTQAATAIENARLYGEAQRVAVLEERQRLSRELHDSVSQALFGIGLGARTARTLLQRNAPEKALGSVDYVVSLAEGGMAEMRALLFELRPESLATEGLVAALTKQAAVLTLRHELAVDTALGDEPDVSLDIKEALFRIAQEALHNIVKHARARTVQIHLSHEEDNTILSVRDDGAGFDPTGSFPGHIGQHSMRERAERLGGTVTVESAVGQGTCIVVRLP